MINLDTVQYTLYVVDDDDAFRESLVWLLTAQGYRVQGFASAEDFLVICDQVLFGCLLVDVRMPGASGLELHERLVSGGIQIPTLVMSGHGDVHMAISAFRKGVVDFLEKPLDDRYLLSRIEYCIAADRTKKRRLQSDESVARKLASLTPREKEVFDCILGGLLNKQIADKLGISIKTVEVYRGRMMEKIGAASVIELVKFSLSLPTVVPLGPMNHQPAAAVVSDGSPSTQSSDKPKPIAD